MLRSADPDAAMRENIMKVEKMTKENLHPIVSEEEEKFLKDHGAPSRQELMAMGRVQRFNLALELGIREDVLNAWMWDETLEDLGMCISLVLQAHLLDVIHGKYPQVDWKEVCHK